jgi:hypothetical protein
VYHKQAAHIRQSKVECKPRTQVLSSWKYQSSKTLPTPRLVHSIGGVNYWMWFGSWIEALELRNIQTYLASLRRKLNVMSWFDAIKLPTCSENGECFRRLKDAIHSQLNWAILLCDVIPDGKNWVNCAVLTGNSAGFGTVISSRLSHTELRSSLRESHSFLANSKWQPCVYPS